MKVTLNRIYSVLNFKKQVSFCAWKSSYDRFERQKAINPQTAFLYDPSISLEKKKKILQSRPFIKTKAELSKLCGLIGGVYTNKNSKLEDFFVVEKDPTNHSYIDLSRKENSPRFEYLSSIFETSYLMSDLHKVLGTTNRKISQYVNDKKLHPVQLRRLDGTIGEIGLYDIKDERNKEIVEKLLRAKPQKSKYFLEESAKTCFVPLAYIEKLGFGTHQDLVNAIKAGDIKIFRLPSSKNDNNSTDKKIYVLDTASLKTRNALKKLRNSNPDIVELKAFSSMYCLYYEKVLQAIHNGDLDIIPEYIFKEDERKIYINLSNQKNQTFIKRLQQDKNGGEMAGLYWTNEKEHPNRTLKREYYFKMLKEKPNCAFLYNPDLSDEEIEEEIKQRPYIKKQREIANLLSISTLESKEKHITTDMFFICESNIRYKSSYIDTSIEENKRNYEYISKLRKHCMTKTQLARMLHIKYEHVKDLIDKGHIKPVKMESLNGDLIDLPLYDIEDEDNIKTFKIIEKQN